MSGACDTRGRDEKCTLKFLRNPDDKRPFERPRRISYDNTKMDLRTSRT
jgi:hypothetical protein